MAQTIEFWLAGEGKKSAQGREIKTFKRKNFPKALNPPPQPFRGQKKKTFFNVDATVHIAKELVAGPYSTRLVPFLGPGPWR